MQPCVLAKAAWVGCQCGVCVLSAETYKQSSAYFVDLLGARWASPLANMSLDVARGSRPDERVKKKACVNVDHVACKATFTQHTGRISEEVSMR